MTTSIQHNGRARLWAYLGAALVPAACVALCLALIIALISLITRLEAERLQNSRASVILVELQERLETDLGLGFSLAESEAAQPLLEKSISLDSTIRAVEVLDERGVSLFNTDRGAIGEYVPRPWLREIEARRSAQQRSGWSVNTATERTLAEPIKGSFGEVQGYVAVTFATDQYVDRSGFILYAVLLSALSVALWAFICAYLNRARVEHSAAAFMQTRGDQTPPHMMIEQVKQRLDNALVSLNGIAPTEDR